MWALRRASIHLRNRCLSLESTRICAVKSEIESCYLKNYDAELTQSQVKRRFHDTSSSSKSFSISNLVSSSIGGKSSGDDNGVLEDHSSRHETRHDVESISESVHSVDEEVQNELEGLEGESDVGEKKYPKTGAFTGLTKVLVSSAAYEASKFLDKWVEAGNEVTRAEVSSTTLFLLSRRLFAKAWKLYEWLESREKIEFTEDEYACRVDLIAKLQGWFKAEEYIQQIPESFRTEVVYNSLLRNYVRAADVYRSEKLFNKMKDLFPLTVISYNQMLFLYKRTDRKKCADVMEFMEKESIKPSRITYQILIDVKGQSSNISEMEQIFETMKFNGVEPSLHNRASMAQYYAASGLKNKAEAVLKDMEGGDLVKNRAACCYLLPIYASLGRGDEVGRIWKECESNPNLGECIVAVKAFGQLKRIEEAEAVFEQMLSTLERGPSSYLYAILLDVYADHKMVTEGEDLFRRMRESCSTICKHAWDALVKLYIGVGEVGKADAALEEATQLRKGRPNFVSFLKILEGYAARGDMYNAEKIFLKMRRARFTVGRRRPYQSLLYAYINAKTPAYGFGQRLKEDNVVPDEKLARLLARTAAFRSSSWCVR